MSGAGRLRPPSGKRDALTVADVRRRRTLTPAETALFVGCSLDVLYETIAAGRAPWPVLRLGRKILIPTAPLLDSLGLADVQEA